MRSSTLETFNQDWFTIARSSMSGLRRFLFSAVIAAGTTAGFVAAVGATKDGLVGLLFGGFWIGIYAFLGFVGLSRRLDRVAKLTLLSSAEYKRLQDRGDAELR